jgi:hypothetical protein
MTTASIAYTVIATVPAPVFTLSEWSNSTGPLSGPQHKEALQPVEPI